MKLIDAPEVLLVGMQAFAAACNHAVSRIKAGVAPKQYALQKDCYKVVREAFGLKSMMAQSALKHVAGAYATIKALNQEGRHPEFSKPISKFIYGRDWRMRNGKVSITTPQGRFELDFECRPLHREWLQTTQLCGATLIKRNGEFHLQVCVEFPDAPLREKSLAIGLDRGLNVTAVAATAPGSAFFVQGGKRIKDHRRVQRELRQRLQGKGTRSAKRVISRLASRERRLVMDQGRKAAKHLVDWALKQSDAPFFRVEDLSGVRNARTRGAQGRAALNSWAYNVTEKCLRDKCAEVGIQVESVDPAYTSQLCPVCHHVERGNRSGVKFACKACSFTGHADWVAARNISVRGPGDVFFGVRGRVNGPDGCSEEAGARRVTGRVASKPTTSVVGG
ncbi:MAG: transposase [Ilumatobacteraceae bacterium]